MMFPFDWSPVLNWVDWVWWGKSQVCLFVKYSSWQLMSERKPSFGICGIVCSIKVSQVFINVLSPCLSLPALTLQMWKLHYNSKATVKSGRPPPPPPKSYCVLSVVSAEWFFTLAPISFLFSTTRVAWTALQHAPLRLVSSSCTLDIWHLWLSGKSHFDVYMKLTMTFINRWW